MKVRNKSIRSVSEREYEIVPYPMESYEIVRNSLKRHEVVRNCTNVDNKWSIYEQSAYCCANNFVTFFQFTSSIMIDLLGLTFT